MKTIIADINSFPLNAELFIKSLKEFCPNETTELMFSTIKNRCFFCFVFNDNNEVVSWCRVAKPWNRKTIYVIRQIETKEKFKRKGYAEICYSEAEKYISTLNNAKKIITFVDNENTPSIRFHEKNGYVRTENTSKYLIDLYGWNSAIMFEKKVLTFKQELSI